MLSRLLITVAAAALGASSSSALVMSLKFSWSGYPRCSSSSPAFTIADVPSGTARLAFKMVDENVPSYAHGGGTIAYDGKSEIPAGAFSYTGPCPPAGQQHSYAWTVQALYGNGKVLASAIAVGKFPPR